MDPEQLVAQLAELRTQNQQLHQVWQQMQQLQNQHQRSQNQCQSLIQALSELPQSSCADSGIGSAGSHKSNANQSDLGGYEMSEKASTAEEYGE